MHVLQRLAGHLAEVLAGDEPEAALAARQSRGDAHHEAAVEHHAERLVAMIADGLLDFREGRDEEARGALEAAKHGEQFPRHLTCNPLVSLPQNSFSFF